MKQSRLFVGGLGDEVDKDMLISKLSPYGSIIDAIVKEKTDADGNVMQRFAYVNIAAAQEQLEQCIKTLNGSVWQGSSLRVEVAKESFLDRLKRERAERQGHKHIAQNFSRNDSVKKFERHQGNKKEPNKKDYKVFPNEKRKQRNLAMDPNNIHESFKMSKSPDENDNELSPAKRKAPRKNKNYKEEEMMASFKTFSSVWADSDEDEGCVISNKERRQLEEALSKKKDDIVDNESETLDSDGMEVFEDAPSEQEGEAEKPAKSKDKRQNWGLPKVVSDTKECDTKENDPSFKPMTRYDPTLHQTSSLPPGSVVEGENDEETNNEVATGLRLVSLFQDSKPKEEEEEVLKEPVKKQSFFLSSSDERIQEGIDWMRQNVQEKILPEFKAIEDELYEVIKTRYARAKRDMNKKFDNDSRHKRKNMEKLYIFKSATTPMFEEQTYDHGWRLAEVIQDEKKRGHHNNSRDGVNGRPASHGEKGHGGRQNSTTGGRQTPGKDQLMKDVESKGNDGNKRSHGGFGHGSGGKDIQSAWFGRNISQGVTDDSVTGQA
ncbi:probable RNA-binding protein CG14230 [Macrobrachium nipponense]|uniref:probable RNA-binding protein CG14230 n=1 Tax=Macrobrachium nipponense TaxID=159736 RepID=UPI0030C87FB7